MRKVLEVWPALHETVQDAAHYHKIPQRTLTTLLAAYALEHLDAALHEADRLLPAYDRDPERDPTLSIVPRHVR